MNILVRLPNWLGDMVMSIGFINALKQVYPDAAISVIAKKGIHALLDFFPETQNRFIFAKEDYAGVAGAWRFGRHIKKQSSFDLFFCLPDSFSSALIGLATGAGQRIGYRSEMRSPLFTQAFTKGTVHRVAEYINLLEQFVQKKITSESIRLNVPVVEKKNRIIININSEASSRRLPFKKAVSIIHAVRPAFADELVLIGGNQDKPNVDAVMNQLADTSNIINMAGKTSLPELVHLISAAKLVLTTDSGPAHLANALGIPTVTLFGAGNEKKTAPFNQNNSSVIRLGKLSCEPCVKNVCVLYGIPKCLDSLSEKMIVDTMLKAYK